MDYVHGLSEKVGVCSYFKGGCEYADVQAGICIINRFSMGYIEITKKCPMQRTPLRSLGKTTDPAQADLFEGR